MLFENHPERYAPYVHRGASVCYSWTAAKDQASLTLNKQRSPAAPSLSRQIHGISSTASCSPTHWHHPYRGGDLLQDRTICTYRIVQLLSDRRVQLNLPSLLRSAGIARWNTVDRSSALFIDVLHGEAVRSFTQRIELGSAHHSWVRLRVQGSVSTHRYNTQDVRFPDWGEHREEKLGSIIRRLGLPENLPCRVSDRPHTPAIK